MVERYYRKQDSNDGCSRVLILYGVIFQAVKNVKMTHFRNNELLEKKTPKFEAGIKNPYWQALLFLRNGEINSFVEHISGIINYLFLV